MPKTFLALLFLLTPITSELLHILFALWGGGEGEEQESFVKRLHLGGLKFDFSHYLYLNEVAHMITETV